MLRLYHEHPEFEEFTRFDTQTGVLTSIGEAEFRHLCQSDSPNTAVFEGDCSPTHTRFPRRVYLQITRKCNLQCDYCFIKARPDGPHLDHTVLEALSRYFGEQGLMEVRLTGGEPTLHPSFTDIYQDFRRHNVYVSVATNCLWSEPVFEFLSEREDLWIIASVDGSEATHNRHRGASYRRVIASLRRLRDKNPAARIRLNMVLTRESRHDLKIMSQLAQELRVENLSLLPLRPYVRDRSVLTDMLTATEFRAVIEEMVQHRRQYGISFTTTIETEFFGEIMPDKIFRKRSSCAAGREGTNLDFDYERQKLVVYGCATSPAVDLKEDPALRAPFTAGEFSWNDIERFGEMWDQEDRWELFRDLSLKSDSCRKCGELGRRCTGSCPIQNIDWENIDVGQDVKEQVFNQVRTTSEWYCYKKVFQDSCHSQ